MARTRMRVAGAALAVAALCALGPIARAAACDIDQQPTALANGRLDALNQEYPITAGDLASYALFVFRGHFHARQAVTFSEDRRRLAKVLQPTAMQRPWRWHFGDGHISYGWTVRHAYAHAGKWRVDVDAYDPGTRRWYPLDQITLTVGR